MYAPTEEFMNHLKKWEQLFLDFHGLIIDYQPKPIERLADIVKAQFDYVDLKVILRWSKIRFYIWMKYLNDKLSVQNNSLRMRAVKKVLHHKY